MKEVEWIAENDGWGIVGWSFECPECGALNRFADHWEEILECTDCDKKLKNPGDPDA